MEGKHACSNIAGFQSFSTDLTQVNSGQACLGMLLIDKTEAIDTNLDVLNLELLVGLSICSCSCFERVNLACAVTGVDEAAGAVVDH